MTSLITFTEANNYKPKRDEIQIKETEKASRPG